MVNHDKFRLKRRSECLFTLIFVLLFSSKALADTGGFNFSGLMFGDYYYVAANHRKIIKDQNGFWLRRIYFTIDKELNQEFESVPLNPDPRCYS